jgi:hypothetical protein
LRIPNVGINGRVVSVMDSEGGCVTSIEGCGNRGSRGSLREMIRLPHGGLGLQVLLSSWGCNADPQVGVEGTVTSDVHLRTVGAWTAAETSDLSPATCQAPWSRELAVFAKIIIAPRVPTVERSF